MRSKASDSDQSTSRPPGVLAYMAGAGMLGLSSAVGASVVHFSYTDLTVAPNNNDSGEELAFTCNGAASAPSGADCKNIYVNVDPSSADFGDAFTYGLADDEVSPEGPALSPYMLGLHASNNKGGAKTSKPGFGFWSTGKGVDVNYGVKSNHFGPDTAYWLGGSADAWDGIGDFPPFFILLGTDQEGKGQLFGEQLTLGFRVSNGDDFNYGWLRFTQALSAEGCEEQLTPACFGPLTLHSLAFETDVNTAIDYRAVPVPGTLGLMIAGLGGLAAARRRRKLAA